jgi:hypothetical protein
MISPTSFSLVAKQLRSALAANIDGVLEGSISISHPNNAEPQESVQGLNLFFYRIEHAGYPTDGTSDNPFYVRLNCLITAFGTDETVPMPGEDTSLTISAGENDLRLIGEVMRVMHEKPILIVIDNKQTMHLQCVLLPLSLDDLSHIWSTQADTAYRLSVAYEMALLPVPLSTPTEYSPLVTSIGSLINPHMQPPVLPATGFAIPSYTPSVKRTTINLSDNDWAPHICFVDSDDSLSYVKMIAETETELDLELLFSGAEGEKLYFYWELWRWDLNSNSGGWQSPVADTLLPEQMIPLTDDPENPLFSNIIDPDNVDVRLKCTVRLPLSLPPPENIRLQACLYAVRRKQRMVPYDEPIDIYIRSNPLAVTVYHEVAS